jgi:UDP-GlcNAc:undecaprenyl-phosphate GlcNAc-1-phosphate transferase
MYLPLLAAFLVPLALSWGLTTVYIRYAPRFGFVDLPVERKLHQKPTPTGAGLAFYLAILAATALLSNVNYQFLLAAVVVALGLLDDHRSLSQVLRLFLYAFVAAVAAQLAIPDAPWEFLAAGAFWIVLLMNAFNFIDNMDGLCAGVSWLVALALYWALRTQYSVLSTQYSGFGSFHLVMLMGALASFYWFNRPPARVFMGDAGSTFLGFFLGVASLRLFFREDNVSRLADAWLAPVCIMAVPIYDLASVAFLRLWERRGLFKSDKNNLSHRLVAQGLRPTTAVRVFWLLGLVGALGGLGLYALPQPVNVLIGVLELACWWGVLPAVECWIRSYRFKKR